MKVQSAVFGMSRPKKGIGVAADNYELACPDNTVRVCNRMQITRAIGNSYLIFKNDPRN